MADGTKITPDIGAIAQFGETMLELQQHHARGASRATGKMAGAITLGMTGTSEAQTLRDSYGHILECQRTGEEDLSRCFESLMYAAVIMTANYRQGDKAQAAAMNVNALWDVFTPAAGTPSIARDAAKAEAAAADRAAGQFAQQREDYFHPAAAADRAAGQFARQREDYFHPAAAAKGGQHATAEHRTDEAYLHPGSPAAIGEEQAKRITAWEQQHVPAPESPQEQVRLFDKAYKRDIPNPWPTVFVPHPHAPGT